MQSHWNLRSDSGERERPAVQIRQRRANRSTYRVGLETVNARCDGELKAVIGTGFAERAGRGGFVWILRACEREMGLIGAA
jgi:hypothetical protein